MMLNLNVYIYFLNTISNSRSLPVTGYRQGREGGREEGHQEEEEQGQARSEEGGEVSAPGEFYVL